MIQEQNPKTRRFLIIYLLLIPVALALAALITSQLEQFVVRWIFGVMALTIAFVVALRLSGIARHA